MNDSMSARVRGVLTLSLMFATGFALRADPPSEEKKADKPAKEEKKRPTTKEEFAALAKEGPLPPWLPFRNGRQANDDRIHGTVIEVAADFIEIRPKGDVETVKYPAHVLLASGAVCHWQSDYSCYLLDDVKKGDEVMLGVGAVDKTKGDECFYLSIRKRPGGVIPASRKPSESRAYHKERQKELDDEATGLPKPLPKLPDAPKKD